MNNLVQHNALSLTNLLREFFEKILSAGNDTKEPGLLRFARKDGVVSYFYIHASN